MQVPAEILGLWCWSFPESGKATIWLSCMADTPTPSTSTFTRVRRPGLGLKKPGVNSQHFHSCWLNCVGTWLCLCPAPGSAGPWFWLWAADCARNNNHILTAWKSNGARKAESSRQLLLCVFALKGRAKLTRVKSETGLCLIQLFAHTKNCDSSGSWVDEPLGRHRAKGKHLRHKG